MSVNRIQFISTTAEVAEAISNLSGLAIAGRGKVLSPKDLPDAKQGNPGTAQNMCRTVIIGYDVVLPGQNFVFAPCAACTGIFHLREGNVYEEDTFYHTGKGTGDP